jgi:hypothetical protein
MKKVVFSMFGMRPGAVIGLCVFFYLAIVYLSGVKSLALILLALLLFAF